MNPTRDEIRALLSRSGLSQAKAATLIYSSLRAFQAWALGERRMPAAKWELLCQKTKPKFYNDAVMSAVHEQWEKDGGKLPLKFPPLYKKP